MKLNNFTSLDPDERLRGVRGLSGVSRLDQHVWDEFHQNWEELTAESEALWEKMVEKRPVVLFEWMRQQDAELQDTTRLTEATRITRVRLTQRFFSEAVLASFNERCCITGNPIPSLLEAAHIQPWSHSPANRVNPRNGLCLSRIHHAAFDIGLFTLDESYRVVLSKELRHYLPNEALEMEFVAHEGKAIRMPEKFPPDPAYLEVQSPNGVQRLTLSLHGGRFGTGTARRLHSLSTSVSTGTGTSIMALTGV